jgi:type I restriction enzyme S subunit
MEKQKNIPLLRFPDFKGEWELIKLDKFFIERNESANVKHPLYSLTIENGIVPKSERYERSFLVNIIEDAYKVMHQDDFAFNPMNLRFGALARHKESKNVAVSKYYNIFFCNEIANSAFFEYYLTSHNLIQFYNKMATGSLIEKKRVHYLDFIKFKKNLPTLPEQTRIASFFTVFDKKITQLKQKKTLLEQYKKGVMQKLFSQELRFKPARPSGGDENGKEFPRWKKKKLGEAFKFKITNSFSRDNLNYEEGTVKNIHYGDIHTKFQTLFDVTKESVPFINSEISIQKIADDNYCREGDLILADASEDLNDVGKSIELVNLNKERLLSGLHTILARPIYGVFASGFCGHLFKSDFVRVQIQKESQGSKVLSISASRLSNVILSFPCIEEQTKIANFLSAIDEKINRTENQIQKTQEWKKGLLQQMFV